MAVSAPLFYDDVQAAIVLALMVFALVIEAWAFVHCLAQRRDAFRAVGTLSKGAWLALLGAAMVFTLPWGGSLTGPTSIFGLIGIGAAALYLLDIRAGLRDLTDGKGMW